MKEDFLYFLDHQSELAQLYNGKYIAIHSQQVVGAYRHPDEAFQKTVQEFDEGSFIIQLCEEGEECCTITINHAIF